MEIADVLKIQNRYLDTQIQTESIKSLRAFNDELIERDRFPMSWRIVSNKVIDILLANGFYFDGYNKRGFRCDKSPCATLYRYDDGSLTFFYGNSQIEIENKSVLTEHYINQLIILKNGNTKADLHEKHS